ncbi:beta-ketoacyl-[acyl-carrier-protein] synthase family protein [soil metagenome]
MSLRISGMGWVTPLGSGLTEVWERLLRGDQPAAKTVASSIDSRTFQIFGVPPEATAAAPTHPRLRRSSAISRYAVVAGLAALQEAGLSLDEATAPRTAIIFAISNGGVVYTKRFYHEVVEAGAQAASPLLFPETVFNAPASHLAAILGITGASYTLVGDGAVGILAMKMADDLMLQPAFDRCLVVGSEEADWLLCDAYRRWRFLRKAPPLEPFATPPRGMVLSEGAGAVLLSRTGAVSVEQIDAGCNFRQQRDAADCVAQVFARLAPAADDLIVASANGTFIDAAERAAVLRHCEAATVIAPKASFGESVGAGSIWQVICAAQALQTRQLPPFTYSVSAGELEQRNGEIESPATQRALVSVCGLNQQVAGLTLRLAS